jgi:hypothetical protein
VHNMEQQASVSKRRGIPLRRAADRPLRSSSRASGRAAQPDAPAAAVAPAPAGFAAGGLPYSESLEHFSRLVHERADGDASAALGAPADTTWTKRAAQGEDDSKDDMAGGGAPPLGSSPLTGKVGEPALGPLDCVPMLAFPKTHHAHKVVIALDNDECIGSWGTCAAAGPRCAVFAWPVTFTAMCRWVAARARTRSGVLSCNCRFWRVGLEVAVAAAAPLSRPHAAVCRAAQRTFPCCTRSSFKCFASRRPWRCLRGC